ncbi:T9SS type A sorting domain-containing protein [Fluviicola sp.]|uniref:T9SS type A sorting domain-containing protein n=1 Tax=Fluviicola sp. TaxID=1917219 RepID=UPI0031E2BB63
MNTTLTLLLLVLLPSSFLNAQCPTCGNGVVDAGETNSNCPSDVSHSASCTSPCAQPGSFESAAGIRQAFDFTGTTTWSTAGLPSGWTFAGAPSATTAGALPAADAYGAKAGLIQPNCSGSCTSTNGFCIGNLANSVAVGSGGANGKLGANFDGRTNTNQNLSYAVLRGQSSPTLVSPTFDMSGVEGFKVQFWLFPSETSCGQSNSWGSCVGNVAYLDFSANGGTSWTQILQMDISSSNTDMCINNSTNTKWLTESAWSRVCLTVFKSTTSPGNYYTAATGTTAASGIMVSSAYFTANFKFRIRYSQTASCTSGITTTNPGRYLAIDYPVITSGDEMIPCGISFANMCGYGMDDNDDGVGSNSATTQTTAFSTVKRSVNQAERGVEILTSQTSAFSSQNLSGSAFATNYDLCNAEGGDQQCIDWQSNNNFYTAVYECITDWEAPTSGINVNYYKGTTPQSFGLTKVTASGKTAAIGWRYSGSRFVSCGGTSDLNSGCNGYLFLSNSLPTQFGRGFYGLATNSLGQAWSYYGATSCSHYFNGPTFAPIAVPTMVTGAPNYTVCSGNDLVFTADVAYCSASSFTGSAAISVSGPGGFSETITAGSAGTNPIVIAGDYFLTGQTPTSPAQCLDCVRTVCVTVSQSDIDNCISTPLPVGLTNFRVENSETVSLILWETESEENSDYFIVERSQGGSDFTAIGMADAKGNSDHRQFYQFTDTDPLPETSYYRLKMVDLNGSSRYSSVISSKRSGYSIQIVPNPNDGSFQVIGLSGINSLELSDLHGKVLETKETDDGVISFHLKEKPGVYVLRINNSKKTEVMRVVVK